MLHRYSVGTVENPYKEIPSASGDILHGYRIILSGVTPKSQIVNFTLDTASNYKPWVSGT